MRAGLDDTSLVHHIDLYGVHDVRKTVGNHYDRMRLGKPIDRGEEHAFALCIDIACRLIEDVEVGAMEIGTGERKALALAAREVLPILRELCLEALLRPEEAIEACRLKRRPELLIRCFRLGHGQVLAHGTRKEIGTDTDGRDMLCKRRRICIGKLERTVADVALVSSETPAHKCRNRRLAGAGKADDSGNARGRDREADIVEHFAFPVIGEAHILEHRHTVLGRDAFLLLRLGKLQEMEDLARGSNAVHRDMEERSELAHRQEEVSREQHDCKRLEDGDRACGKSRERDPDACRSAAQSDDVHHNDGVELHREHFHRDDAEVLCLPVHRLMARPVSPIDLERRESFEILEKGIAELGVLVPVGRKDALCDLLHSHDRERDERHEDEQHDGSCQIHRRNHDEERDRRQDRIEELRQILPEVGLELLASLD
jgi:hypothetical protein